MSESKTLDAEDPAAAASGGANAKTQAFVEPMTASKLQNLIGELFRLQLYRNDDYNLTQSTVLKYLQTSAASQNQAIPISQQKLISDIQAREEDRVSRENQILKEIGGQGE